MLVTELFQQSEKIKEDKMGKACNINEKETVA
jgi:hypothetical protein